MRTPEFITVRGGLFTGFSVRRMLAGAKTHTRRIAWRKLDEGALGPSPWQRVRKGDLFFVKERHHLTNAGDPGQLITAADYAESTKGLDNVPAPSAVKWSPAMYMARGRSRLTLRVEFDAWRERLHDITEVDSMREGVIRLRHPNYPRVSHKLRASRFAWNDEVSWFDAADTARAAYRQMWLGIHGQESWDANPEVVVTEFTPIAINVDRYIAENKLVERPKPTRRPRRDARPNS